MHISWEDLRTIEALVRVGTVLGAARELGLKHSSVSRRVDALERALGAPLFLRGARLIPTALARTVATRAAGMAEQASQIDALLEGERRAREGRRVITTNDVLAPLLFRALAGGEADKQVQVRITDEVSALEPGLTDLALRPGGQPPPTLRGWRLGRLRLGIYRARGGRGGEWVLPATSLRERGSMRWWKAIPAGAPGWLECDTLLSMRDACVAGLGRVVLPAVLAVEDPRLVLEEEVQGGPAVWLLAPATRRAEPAIRSLAERLVTRLKQHHAVWAG